MAHRKVRKKLSLTRKLQKKLIDGADVVGSATRSAAGQVTEQLKEFDDKFAVTNGIRDQGSKISQAYREFDDKVGVTEKGRAIGEVVTKTASGGAEVLRDAAETVGAERVLDDVKRSMANMVDTYSMDQRLIQIGRMAEHMYGATRQVIKPYFPPETPEELLRNTKRELTYISACIMQISAGEAEKLASQFGAAIASKIAGVAVTGTLLSLVSAFGTAGTGTAIASLSGAAAANATLAWVGGLLGGGMATGAVLTGGVTLLVGLGAYRALSSDKRDFVKLDPIEQRIVQY